MNDIINVYELFQRLSADCAQEISGLVKETAKNIHLDPIVMEACQTEVCFVLNSLKRWPFVLFLHKNEAILMSTHNMRFYEHPQHTFL